jgi:hypothetical protein
VRLGYPDAEGALIVALVASLAVATILYWPLRLLLGLIVSRDAAAIGLGGCLLLVWVGALFMPGSTLASGGPIAVTAAFMLFDIKRARASQR